MPLATLTRWGLSCSTPALKPAFSQAESFIYWIVWIKETKDGLLLLPAILEKDGILFK